MRKIDAPKFYRATLRNSKGGWTRSIYDGRALSESDWRKIMRVLRAADRCQARRNSFGYVSAEDVPPIMAAVDALNATPRKRK